MRGRQGLWGRLFRRGVSTTCAAVAAGAMLAAGPGPGSPATATKQAAPQAVPAPEPIKVDLILNAGAILTVDKDFRILRETSIVVHQGVITAIGTPADIAARFVPRERIDRPYSVVMPGLVNTHTHAAMSLLRGIADDRALMDWLQKVIFPAEAKNVSPAFVRDGTILAMAEMIRGGTTTFADMYYYEDDVAQAVDQAGMRAVLGETWLDFPVNAHKDLPESIAYTRKFLEHWKGHPRVVAAVAPHAAYTCSQETLLAARKLADEYNAPLLIHVSETRDEQAQIKARYGAGTTPVKWLKSIGFLGPRVVAAHGVWLDDEDLKILAADRVALSYNPESNMKLASGIAPIPRAIAAGVTVGLGTDGPAGSNNDFDMMEAMDFAGKLAKVGTMDPTVLPGRQLVRMATIEGAKALGLGDRIGSIETGKEADLIAVDLTMERVRPVYDVVSTLVYSAKLCDISLTMVAGKVLYDGRSLKTIDIVPTLKAAAEWREKVERSLAPPPAPTPTPLPTPAPKGKRK